MLGMDKLQLDSLLGNIYKRICSSAEATSTLKKEINKTKRNKRRSKPKKGRNALRKRS